MLKKKKTMASGKLVLVKSVRRTRSHRMKFCVQRGLGALPSTSKRREENHGGDLHSAGRCVLTPALLAPFYPEMKGASEETVKFHSPAQFVSNFSDSSVSSFAVSCVWRKRVSRISDGQLQ